MNIRVSTILVLLLGSAIAFGQVSSTAPLSGTVTDPTGAVISGARVIIKNTATGTENQTTTGANGAFVVPALAAGSYTVTVTAQGFKQAVAPDVKLNAATPASVNITLEIGAATESVVVQGGGEVLQTQTANVGQTIVGRQITELPFTSRDALDLVLLLPGTSTPGRPRTSTVNGLPKGSLNITMDGINVQDNLGKSSDGFFTYIRPRIDAVDEVTVSTATPGAESAGEGAVQIKFVTRGGTNNYKGSLYWYHRNPALNANYYFNNLNNAPYNIKTAQNCTAANYNPNDCKAPRDRVLLNQYGARVGGPISLPGLFSGKDRAFFFVNYEEYRLPEQVTRTRNLLNTDAQRGIFTYTGTSGRRQVNLLTLAAGTVNCPACTSTVDPTIAKILSDIRAGTSAGGVQAVDANRDQLTWVNTGGQDRYFTTVRFDLNVTSKHRIENVWNYQVFRNRSDILNSVDPPFPGILSGIGGQNSNRFSNSIALRSTLTSSLVNEARFGVNSGNSLFRAGSPNSSPAGFANQGGFAFGTSPAAGGFFAAFPTGLSINNPVASRSNQRRNSPVKQFTDNLSYVRGNHSLNLGGTFSDIRTWSDTINNIVPALSFGVDTNDPANSVLFNNTNFPGISGTDLNAARALYAILTGRVTAVNANAYLDEKTGKYNYLGASVERIRQREFGIFAQDAWRARPNLTLTGGVRWEVQFPFTTMNNTYAQTSYAELFGISGEGNLFKPGTTTGRVSQMQPFNPGDSAYNTDWNNFAPSVGLAWSPNWKSGWLRKVMGEGGQSVIRAGYSVAFVREGTNLASSILGSNVGGFVAASRTIGQGNLTPGTLLRNISASTIAPPIPASPNYPLTGVVTNTVNAFAPDLNVGYVSSWTFGVQRELTKDTVFEARYVGNRGTKLWRQYNLNEINVIENGFLNEFKLAQANLAANIAAGRGNNFRYYGPNTGTSPLPIILAHFAGTPAANAGNQALYTSANFASNTFITPLAANNANPIGFANALGAQNSAAALRTNAANAGLPRNFFVANPDYLGAANGTGGAFLVDNGAATWYNALTLEVRRRLSAGLLVQANYTFAKATTDFFASSSSASNNYSTLRNPALNKTSSPFDVTHAFKVNWIYELPVGKGKALFGGASGVVGQFVNGWAWHGTARLQSGSPFRFQDVRLVNMTRQDLQNLVNIRKTDLCANGVCRGVVYYLPDDVITNTQRAFNVSATTANGFGGAAPDANAKYIAPASSGGCINGVTGTCGLTNVVLYGPKFTRFDLSLVKRFRLAEGKDFEFRTEFLNAFNNINFRVGDAANDVTTISNFTAATFGQTTTAYRDLSTTNDSGGRLIQFVLRLNF